MIRTFNRLKKGVRIEYVEKVLKYLLMGVFAFVISRGNIYGYSPMTVACYMSVVKDKSLRFVVLIGLMVGTMTNQVGSIIKYLLILIIIATFVYMFEFFKIQFNNIYAIGGLTTFILTYALPAYVNQNNYGLMGAIAEGVGVVILSILFKGGFENINNKRTSRYIQSAVSMGIITFTVILGLYGIRWLDFSLLHTVVLAVIIQVGYGFGLEMSSIFSVMIAFAYYYVMKDAVYFIRFSVVGITAGIFRKLGKVGCLGGSVAVYIAISNMYSSELIVDLLKSSIIAGSIYMFIPYNVEEQQGKHLSIMNNIFLRELEETALAYGNLGKVFNGIGERKEQLGKEEIDHLIDDVATRTCMDCEMVKMCWKKDFYNTYRTIYSVLEELDAKGQVYVSDIPVSFYNHCIKADEFVKNVNKLFEIYKINLRWENKLNDCKGLFAEQFINTAHHLMQLSNQVKSYEDERYESFESKLRKQFNGSKVRLLDVVCYRDGNDKLRIIIQTEQRYLSEDVMTVMEGLEGSEFQLVEERIAGDITEYRIMEKAKYSLMKGVAKRRPKDLSVSGDNYTTIDLNNHKEIIALSDGMGTGINAYKDSEAAIEVLEGLCEGGFSLDIILRTINALIGVKSNRESFATLDVTMIDKYDLKCEMIKNGAVSTFIKRGEEVHAIRGDALPVGMVKHVECNPIKTELLSEDLLVMVTDGVVDSTGKKEEEEERLMAFLSTTDLVNPQRLAEVIIDYFERDDEEVNDDQSVVVIRCIQKKR